MSDSKLEIRQAGPEVAAAGQMGKATRDARGDLIFYSGVCLHRDEQVVEGLGLSGADWALGCVVVVDLEAGACGGGRSRAGGA